MEQKQNHQHSSLVVRNVQLSSEDTPKGRREKLARIVLDDMYQFVGLLDLSGNLLEVNRAALEGGGISFEEIYGKPFWEAHWWTISHETQERLRSEIARSISGEFVRYDVEVFGSAQGLETITIDFSLIPVKDNNGTVVFLLAEGRNITEKKKAEEEIELKNSELRLLLDRIRELDDLKGQFFANVSHELRTPLALILGPAEKILEEGSYLSEPHRRSLEVIRRNASTLLKQVNDLLDLSKLDAGKMTLTYVDADLGSLLRFLAGNFEAIAEHKGIHFLIEAPQDFRCDLDPDKIERVIMNLLSNAFKFTPPGGTVRLSIESVATSEHALISVVDSGPGVREKNRELIFERFRQAEGGSTREFGGTGLGLSIARDFVRLHHGDLKVQTAPGGGARFVIRLPRKAPASAKVSRATDSNIKTSFNDQVMKGTVAELGPVPESKDHSVPGSQGLRKTGKVLVVEDNPEMNRFILECLSTEFETYSASDGIMGLSLAAQSRPDLVITDIMMPKLSGDGMIRRLRQDPAFDETRIMVLSAKADDQLRNELLEKDAQDYLVKPFSSQELMTRSRNLIAAKHAADALRMSNETLETKVEARTQELKESEERFRTLANSIPQLVWMMDWEGFIFWYNERWYQYTGTTLQEMEGWGWMKVHHPDHVERVVKKFKHHISLGTPWEDTFPLRSSTGEWRWFLSRAEPVRSIDGEIIRWFGSNTDVTERLEVEQKLAHTSSLLQTITDSLDDPVYAKDLEGRMIFMNPATQKVIGKSQREVFGKTEPQWMGDVPVAREIMQNDQRVMSLGKTERVEEVIDSRVFLGTKSPLKDPSGKIIGIVGVSRDITDLRRSADELERLVSERTKELAVAQTRLVQTAKMSALGEMAGGIAHEINTPLAAITMKAQQLERIVARSLDPELVAKSARSIVEISKRIGAIIRGLRTFARDGTSDPLEERDLNDLIESALSLCRSRFEHHETTVKFTRSAPVVVPCRAVQIEQVLINLLGNAFDAVQSANEKWIKVSLDESIENVQISVTDSGPGIDKEIEGKLMQPFFTTKPIGKGTGLGLSISKGIIDDHRGSLTIDKKSPHTKFVVCLPRIQEPRR